MMEQLDPTYGWKRPHEPLPAHQQWAPLAESPYRKSTKQPRKVEESGAGAGADIIYKAVSLQSATVTSGAFRTIEEWYLEEDGNDWAPAWDRCMGQGDGLIPPISEDPFTGGTVVFGSGFYYFSRRMDVTRPMIILGHGRGATTLRFTQSGGIKIWFPNQDPEHPRPGKSGSETRIQDLFLFGSGQYLGGVHHGIDMQIKAHIAHCSVAYFPGHGVQMLGDVTVQPPTGCNTATCTDVRVVQCGGTEAIYGLDPNPRLHAGYYLQGGDANANTFTTCDATDCGVAGFLDESFLGNNYTNCHANLHIRDGVYPPAFVSKRSSQRSCFVGCYQEGLNLSEITAPSSVWGGWIICKPGFSPCQIKTLTSGFNFATGLTSSAPAEGAEVASMICGKAAGAPFSVQSSRDVYGYSMGREINGPWKDYWTMRRANSQNFAVLAMRCDNKTNAPAELAAPMGLRIGAPIANARAVASRPAIPSIAECSLGDVVMVVQGDTVQHYQKRDDGNGPYWKPLALA